MALGLIVEATMVIVVGSTKHEPLPKDGPFNTSHWMN